MSDFFRWTRPVNWLIFVLHVIMLHATHHYAGTGWYLLVMIVTLWPIMKLHLFANAWWRRTEG